jgi:CcmD family protein
MTLRASTLCLTLAALLAAGAGVDAHGARGLAPRPDQAGESLTLVERLHGVGANRASAQPVQTEPQDEFRPISELPPEEKLPAAPLLVAAYVLVSLLLFGYVYSLAKRFSGLRAEIERLEGDIKRGHRH